MQLKRRAYSFLCLTSLLYSLSLPGGAAPARSRTQPPWRYIVIHHSATRKGNAEIMERYHRNRRGMANGLAYHFVIDNGTSGRADGQVEEGRRWRAQLPGGHSKQDWLNQSGIGICLVGNFNRQCVSKKQMDSLVALVNRLRKAYGIPMNCIKGHGEFRGEHTMCPGRNFPMRQLKERLKAAEAPEPARRTLPLAKPAGTSA